jgi:hypothetical protein
MGSEFPQHEDVDVHAARAAMFSIVPHKLRPLRAASTAAVLFTTSGV